MFGSTFYQDDLNTNYEHYRTDVKEFDETEREMDFEQNSMLEDFIKKVEGFGPNLIDNKIGGLKFYRLGYFCDIEQSNIQ